MPSLQLLRCGTSASHITQTTGPANHSTTYHLRRPHPIAELPEVHSAVPVDVHGPHDGVHLLLLHPTQHVRQRPHHLGTADGAAAVRVQLGEGLRLIGETVVSLLGSNVSYSCPGHQWLAPHAAKSGGNMGGPSSFGVHALPEERKTHSGVHVAGTSIVLVNPRTFLSRSSRCILLRCTMEARNSP